MKLKILSIVAVFFFCTGLCFADENDGYSLSQLLSGYLANDVELKKLTLDVQKTALSFQISEINNGFDITLSTGTMSFSAENGSLTYSVNPSVKATLPEARNLSFSASSDININSSSKTMKNTALSVSADIISPDKTKRDVTLLQAEHELLSAKRKVQQRALTLEKSFYSEIKLLYENAQSIFSAKNSLYDDTIKFEQIKAEGYLSGSSTYKLSQMSVLSDERNVATANRVFAHNVAVFYRKCGAAVPAANEDAPLKMVPVIKKTETYEKARNFPAETYKTIADALWSHEINVQSRSAPNFALSANGGYTFKNSRTDSDSVDAGLSADLSGLKLSTGVNVPVNNKKSSPSVTLSATASPNTRRISKLEKKQQDIANEQELLVIDSAYEAYEESCTECDENLEDLLWQLKTNRENYNMYQNLEKELQGWYKEGYIRKSEYLSAKNNRDLYGVKCIMNELDLVMYNNTVKLLFYFDDELD